MSMNREQAILATAAKMEQTALGIREEDLYASHVTEEQKDDNLTKSLRYAKEVRKGEHLSNLTVAQRIRYYETGECLPILPKY